MSLIGAGVGVLELDRSILWYSRLLGLQVVSRFDVAALDLGICLMERGETILELMAPLEGKSWRRGEPPPRHARPGRIAHLVFAVPDLEDFARHMEACDARIAWRAPDTAEHRFLFTTDPDGNPIQIIERRK